MNVLVTITFNALKDDILEPFFASIDAQADRDFLLLVIDNASTDGTADYLRRLARPNVHVILNAENIGFGRACNQGVAFARERGAKYVTFINNDTEFGGELIGGMVASLEEQGVDGLMPLITFHSQQDRIWFLTGSFRWTRGIIPFHNHIGRRRDEVPMKPIEPTAFATGCCIVLRLDAIEEVGGFDERFFVYWEDADLSKAMTAAGKSIVVDTRLELHHKVSVSTGGSFGPFSMFHFTRGHIIFVRKHHGMPVALGIVAISFVKALLNALRGRMAWREMSTWRRGIVAGLLD